MDKRKHKTPINRWMFSITVHQENTNQDHNEILFYLHMIGQILKLQP